MADRMPDQTVAEGAPGALDFSCIGIDLPESARWRERGSAAELKGEIHPLANKHDRVALGQDIGDTPQRGIGSAARAFHSDNGNAGSGFTLFHKTSSRARQHLRTD